MSHHAVITLCVVDAHYFFANPSSVCDYEHRAYVWGVRVGRTYRRYLSGVLEVFLTESRVVVALENLCSFYLGIEFRKEALTFLEEL